MLFLGPFFGLACLEDGYEEEKKEGSFFLTLTTLDTNWNTDSPDNTLDINVIY